METQWLDDEQLDAWVKLVAVVELLPGVLDSQLRRDAGFTHFEYFVLAMLSEAPDSTLRMTSLAQRTNATLPRLSHVVRRLEERDLVERFPCPEDGARRTPGSPGRGGRRSWLPRPVTPPTFVTTSSTPSVPSRWSSWRDRGCAAVTARPCGRDDSDVPPSSRRCGLTVRDV